MILTGDFCSLNLRKFPINTSERWGLVLALCKILQSALMPNNSAPVYFAFRRSYGFFYLIVVAGEEGTTFTNLQVLMWLLMASPKLVPV
jgi:hypothetical protein